MFRNVDQYITASAAGNPDEKEIISIIDNLELEKVPFLFMIDNNKITILITSEEIKA
jgi:hypothetical protein